MYKNSCGFVCEDFPQENQTQQKRNDLCLSTNIAIIFIRCQQLVLFFFLFTRVKFRCVFIFCFFHFSLKSQKKFRISFRLFFSERFAIPIFSSNLWASIFSSLKTKDGKVHFHKVQRFCYSAKTFRSAKFSMQKLTLGKPKFRVIFRNTF